MAEHTPGPWEAVPPKKTGKHWTVCAAGRLGGIGTVAGLSCKWAVARIDNGAPGDTLETEAANARLVAASPALLAACKRGLDALACAVEVGGADPATHLVCCELRAAVALARGTKED